MNAAQLDALARSLIGPFAFCGIALAQGDNTHLSIATAPRISAGPDTMFRVASISKIIVGQAVAAFVKTKATTWQTDMSDILGWRLRNPDFPDTPITLGMVASHSAGLTDEAGYVLAPDTVLAEWCRTQPIHSQQPGTYFSYSNLGYLILAAALEKLAGQPFPDAVRHLLPERAGFNWVGVDGADRLPTYRRNDSGFVAQIDETIMRVPEGTHPGVYSPQGGLRLSLKGMLALAQGLRNADATPLWTHTMGSGDYEGGVFESYGAGLQIFDTPNFYPRPLIGHFGNAYGFRGGVWYDRERDLSVAYALNGLARGDEDDAFSDAELQICAALADWKG